MGDVPFLWVNVYRRRKTSPAISSSTLLFFMVLRGQSRFHTTRRATQNRRSAATSRGRRVP